MKSCFTSTMFYIIIVSMFVLACENTTTRPINEPQTQPVSDYNGTPDYTDNTNNVPYEDPRESWHQQELKRQIKEYPVILAIDHVKPVLMQKEMIFSGVSQALSGTFNIIDTHQLDKDIRDEVMSTTGAGSITYQDILFRKFSAADVCVYLWCEINPYEGNVGGRPITFHEGRMGCRVVDTFSKQLLADIVKSTGRQHYNSGSEDDKQRRAVEMMLPELASELQYTLDSRISDIIKNSFRIRGVIETPRDLDTFKLVIKDLEAERYFNIQRVISESAHFEYEISNPNRNVSGISELLKETASIEGLKINVRVTERANTKLIQVSLGDRGFDD